MSIRPNRSTAASTAACAAAGSVMSSETASRLSCSPRAAVTLAASRAVADDAVAGVEGGLGQVDAHAAGGAGDEPDGRWWRWCQS